MSIGKRFNAVVDMLVRWTTKLFSIPVWILVKILPVTDKQAMEIISVLLMWFCFFYGV
jgi:hypothetical protein